jgi:Mrp family chromosome partitioning ATPase/capsular polysaccharide biosynthesis protein
LFATSGEVPKRAAESIGFDAGGAALAGQITVSAVQEQAAIVIATMQDSPDAAVRMTDAVGDQLVGYLAEREDLLREQRLTATLERLEDLEDRLDRQSAQALQDPSDAVLQAKSDALARQYSVAFEQYDTLRSDRSQLVLQTLARAEAVAVEEAGLSAPRSRFSRGVLGALVGLAAGVVTAMLLARIDRKLRTVEQIEQVYGYPLQLAIPRADPDDLRTVVINTGRHDSLSDSYRRVRSLITFIEAGLELPQDRSAVIGIVSAGPAEGKTSMSVNLSAALAETGRDVVAVNTDFRRPALSGRLLGRKDPSAGLTLDDVATTPARGLLQNSAVEGVRVLDLAGIAASPGDLARATCRLLPEVTALADAVVIDTSPISATAEVLELLPQVDVLIVTVRLGHTSIDSARRTAGTISALSGAEPVLVLVGGGDERSGEHYYYDYSSGDRSSRKGRRSRT